MAITFSVSLNVILANLSLFNLSLSNNLSVKSKCAKCGLKVFTQSATRQKKIPEEHLHFLPLILQDNDCTMSFLIFIAIGRTFLLDYIFAILLIRRH